MLTIQCSQGLKKNKESGLVLFHACGTRHCFKYSF